MAIRVSPNWAEPYFHLGIAYGNQEKLDYAIAAWKAATHINPDFAKAHYNLARAYALKNQKDLAIQALQKTVALLDRKAIQAAKTDRAFEKIRESPEFQNLINTVE